MRKELNGLIRSYIAAENRRGNKSLVLLDLEPRFSNVNDKKVGAARERNTPTLPGPLSNKRRARAIRA